MAKMLGIGAPHQNAGSNRIYYDLMLGTLWPPCWHNWLYDQREYIYPPYYPTVYKMAEDANSEQAAIVSHYGPRLWHLGTEPNNDEQSNTSGRDSAKFSQWWANNAAGSVALPGLLVMHPDTMGAVAWMEEYLDAGGIIPAYWSVDNYAWTPSQWDGNLDPFRELIARRGVERPIIVKECASWSSEVDEQKAIMSHIYKRLNDDTIHEAFWYSTYDPFGPFRAADLLTTGGMITEVGAHYMSLKGTPLPPPEPPPDMDKKVFLPVVAG